MNNKTVARYFFGIALLIEGICMSTNSAEYPKMYWYPLIQAIAETTIVHVLMAGITSIILGAGALTLSNNPTGFNLAILGLMIRIVVIYLPNLYNSTDLKNTRQ